VEHLCGEYAGRPAAELRADAQRWLSYICTQLDSGRVSLTAHRELLVSAGWLTLLIGSLEHDLGMRSAALATRAAALHLGEEAGHSEIAGWAHELGAWIDLTSSHPHAALRAARAGQAARQGGHATVQLIAHEAKSLARLGDDDGVRSAIDRGTALVEKLPLPDCPHHFRPDLGKFRFLAMDCYRHVGDNEAAESSARRIIAGADVPAGRRPSMMRQAEAWLTIGVVAARNGQLDEAVSAGSKALECGPRRSLPSLLLCAQELGDELSTRWPAEQATLDFRERLQAVAAAG
jgi:tetratricopeptide (TPR) repeat protein